MKEYFSTKEAAEYLGISFSGLRHHIYVKKDVTGQKVGNSLLFTREQLDKLKPTIKVTGMRPRTVRMVSVIKSFKAEGLSHKEIAEKLEINPSYVTHLLKREIIDSAKKSDKL